MVTFYRSHRIEVNKQPNEQVLFDVYNRLGQHLLSGFSQRGSEQNFVEYAKTRVDQFISERPIDVRDWRNYS